MKIPAVMVAAAIVAGTSCGSRPADQASLQAGIPDAAAVAIFAELARLSPSDPRQVHCLQIDGRDPPAAVVSKMGGSGSKVVPLSECTIEFKRQVHAKSGRPAIVHYIRAFSRYGSTAADAHAGIVIDGLDATHYRIEVRFESGKWRVEQLQATGVS